MRQQDRLNDRRLQQAEMFSNESKPQCSQRPITKFAKRMKKDLDSKKINTFQIR